MEIIFHAHNAPIPERLRRRAESSLKRLSSRMSRAVDAIVRFEQDGPMRRVEIVLHSPRQRDVIALAEGRYYGPALTAAIGRLSAQVRKMRRAHKPSVKKRAATKARKLGTIRSRAAEQRQA